MPSVRPADRIFELPYVVVKALSLLRATQIGKGRTGEVQGQQSGKICGVTISDSKRVAELSDARGPAITAVERHMAPTDAGIIHKITVDRSGPVANGIVNWCSRIGIG